MRFHLIIDDLTNDMETWLNEHCQWRMDTFITYSELSDVPDTYVKYKIKFVRKNDMMFFKLTWGGKVFKPEIEIGQTWFYGDNTYTDDLCIMKRKVLAVETLPEIGKVVVYDAGPSRHIIQHKAFIQWIRTNMAQLL